MKLLLITLLAIMNSLSCATFWNDSCPTPINNSLGNLSRSKADSSKTQKQLIIANFGKPDHKFISINLDTCYMYFYSNSHEEICFDGSGHSTSIGSGVGKPRLDDIQEEYYNYDAVHKEGQRVNYIGSINKALGIKQIEDASGVIRIYYLPSFQKEQIYEIDSKMKGKIIRFTPVENSVWIDLYDFRISDKGDTIGGKIKKVDEYVPKVSINIDTATNDSVYEFSMSLFKSIGLDTLKCIRYKDIITSDGGGIKVYLNWANTINKIEYQDAKYRNGKYNKITDLIKTKLTGLFK